VKHGPPPARISTQATYTFKHRKNISI